MRIGGLALGLALAGTAASAQENAECNQHRATVSAAIQTFAQIGPRLEQLEKSPEPAAANEQRQLARTGIDRATSAERAIIRLQSLQCLGFNNLKVDWGPLLAESRRLIAQFTAASKRK